MRITRPIEFGVADLMSLEPVDIKFRPLRLNAYLWDKMKWEMEYVRGGTRSERRDLRQLRENIVDLLQTDCNMRKIVKMCKGFWPDPANMDSIYEPAIVDIDT